MVKCRAKRLLCFLLCAIFCFILCGCNDNAVYKKQEGIIFNYNNISAGMCNYWLENDAAFYSKHNLLFDIYKTSEENTEKIADTDESSANIQVYGDKLYYTQCSTLSNDVVIKSYNLTTGETAEVANVETEFLCEYYVVGDYIFVETGYHESFKRNLQCLSLRTGTQTSVANDIVVCGIANDSLRYVKAEESGYSVFEYDEVKNRSVCLGNFEVELSSDDEILAFANFTWDKIILNVNNYVDNTSKLLIFSISKGSLETVEFDYPIYDTVAHSDYLFFVGDSNTDSQNIYRMCIETLDIKEIAEFYEAISIFVTSDEDVYVQFLEKQEIIHCTVGGTSEKVFSQA